VRDSDEKQSVWQYFQVYLRFLLVFLILKNILGKRVEITRWKQVKNTMNNEALFHLFFTCFGLVIEPNFKTLKSENLRLIKLFFSSYNRPILNRHQKRFFKSVFIGLAKFNFYRLTFSRNGKIKVKMTLFSPLFQTNLKLTQE
jgi:hypothetical protein